ESATAWRASRCRSTSSNGASAVALARGPRWRDLVLGVSAPSTLRPGRVRMLLLAVAVFFAVVAAAVAVVITSREGAPATGAASVVPDDALAYIHLSTDPDRQAVKQALQMAAKLPDFALFSGQLTGRLGAVAAGGTRVNFQRDIRPWLGNEAALALLNTQSSTAGSLIVLDVRKPAKARSFIAGAGATSAGVYEGTGLYRYRTGTELA